MKELSLFTGAGGGIWGTKLLGWRCLGYVEVNPYCQKVVEARIKDRHFDDAPVFGDVRAFIHPKCGHAWRYRGLVDVLTAGFPCQPFSPAGKRLGGADARNLWPETIRCVRIVRPRCVFLENSATLTSNPYFGTILGDLAEAGYDAEWCVLGADDVGDPPAPHERKRVWILAHTDEERRDGRSGVQWSRRRTEPAKCRWWDIDPADLPDADEFRMEGQGTEQQATRIDEQIGMHRWPVESRVGRVVDGLANRRDRVTAIGEGQVPEVVATAWSLLRGAIEVNSNG